MKTFLSLLVAALMAFSVASSFAQGTVVFNNSTTGLVLIKDTWVDSHLRAMPKDGGEVQLFWAAAGTAYTPWNPSLIPSAWYAANPGWSLGPVVGFTTTVPGEFDGGVLTLSPLSPGGTIDYVVIGWTGNSASFDAALATTSHANVSLEFTSSTGNPTTAPPEAPVTLASSFGGLVLLPIPEPSVFALASLGSAIFLALRRRK